MKKQLKKLEKIRGEIERLRNQAKENMKKYSDNGDIKNTEFWGGVEVAYRYVLDNFLEE